MTLEDLRKIKSSLMECKPDVEDFSWGPTYEFALQRKGEALKILNREIRSMNKEKHVEEN